MVQGRAELDGTMKVIVIWVFGHRNMRRQTNWPGAALPMEICAPAATVRDGIYPHYLVAANFRWRGLITSAKVRKIWFAYNKTRPGSWKCVQDYGGLYGALPNRGCVPPD